MSIISETTATLFSDTSVTDPNAEGIFGSIPIFTIVEVLLFIFVTILGMAILSWFLKRCCCCRSNRTSSNSRNDYDQEHSDIEERGRGQARFQNENDSTIPSVITISGGSISNELRWRRRSLSQISQTSDAGRNKQVFESSSVSLNRQRFSRRNGRGLRSFNASRASHARTSPSNNIFFDHTTVLTSSCDDMSLPDDDVRGKTVDTTGNSGSNNNRIAVDPPGARLGEAVVSLTEDTESYPNATIQFRNPINGNDSNLFDEEEIELLVDFLIHTEDYVRYPRSKLTILLRARVPDTEEEKEQLQHLQAIIEDASSSAPVAPLRDNETCIEQQRRPPIQVLITTTSSKLMSSEEDILRCAPIGGFLVTFGSVWEIPEGHLDFLKDIV